MRTHLRIFFADRGDVAVLKARDKIAQPDRLALLAIRSNKHRKSRERAYLAIAGEFNRRYLTLQISAILYADRGHRRIKSPSVSLALDTKCFITSGAFKIKTVRVKNSTFSSVNQFWKPMTPIRKNVASPSTPPPLPHPHLNNGLNNLI